jgi:hypothetical protein
VGRRVLALPEFEPGEVAGVVGDLNPHQIAPLITVTCDACAHVAFFSPTVLGVF